MARELEIAPGTRLPVGEIELRASRSSGPGGQHANVTESRVEAVFRPASSRALDAGQRRRIEERLGEVVVASAQDTRSQTRNRELALERLAERLRGALVTRPTRRPTRPRRAAKERRLDAKRRRSETKRQRRRPREE